jgi:cytochrome c biogenesis protein CcmG, thiol:disulfide interchange protein DsbE
MSTRATVALGLLAGLLVGVVAWAALVAFGPIARPAETPPPSLSLPTPPPSAGASVSASTSGSAGASPSAPASASSGAGALFGVGQPAPPLRVPQLGGGTIDLAALRGKPVWVNFMATWCPPCRDEIPVMGGFAGRYAAKGLVVLAIDVKEDEGTVGSFMTSLNATIPVGLDADGSAQSTWRAAALPVHFWVDTQGIVRDGAFGGIGPDVMAAGLRKILPGVNVTP